MQGSVVQVFGLNFAQINLHLITQVELDELVRDLLEPDATISSFRKWQSEITHYFASEGSLVFSKY